MKAKLASPALTATKPTLKRKEHDHRPKPSVIQTIPEGHPWVILSKAAMQSGLSEKLIRQAGIPLRKFGNAHYVAPAVLNAWISKDPGPQPTTQPSVNPA
jgi:hypothetical protein